MAESGLIEFLDTTDAARRLWGYKGETRIWTVKDKSSGLGLGDVIWGGKERGYVFSPGNIKLDSAWLKRIARFCEWATREANGRQE